MTPPSASRSIGGHPSTPTAPNPGDEDPYRPARVRAETLRILLAFLFVIFVFGCIEVRDQSWDQKREFIEVFLAANAASLGVVVAFYFQSNADD